MALFKNFLAALLFWFCFLALCTILIGKFDKIQDQQLKEKTNFLMNEGYTFKAAEHIAKVELNLIPIDQEYTALIED